MTALAQARPAAPTANVSPDATGPSAGPGREVAVVMDFVGATLPQVDHLRSVLRLKPGGPGLPGSLFQWSRDTPDGVRITEVWRSARHFEVFLRDVITPRLSSAGLPDPEITTYEVHTFLTQGPLVDLEPQRDAMATS